MNQLTANWIKENCNGKIILLSGGLRNLSPLQKTIVFNMSKIESIRFIKVKPEAIMASNLMVGIHKSIITKPEHPKAIGIWIEFDFKNRLLEFAEITSFKKGNGQRMVAAALSALPRDWSATVVFDYSDGFWKKMRSAQRRSNGSCRIACCFGSRVRGNGQARLQWMKDMRRI